MGMSKLSHLTVLSRQFYRRAVNHLASEINGKDPERLVIVFSPLKVWVLGILLVELIALGSSCTSEILDGIPFEHIIIDNDAYGLSEVGDINGDSLPDTVSVSSHDRPLIWYEYPNWTKHPIRAIDYMADDVELADLDSDGDLDVIAAKDGDVKVLWYENPRPRGDPATDTWTEHLIGIHSDPDENYVKDIGVADFTGDGKLDVVTRAHTTVCVFRQDTPSSWTQIQYLNIHKKEGMDVGDLDGDGDPDIVLNGFWLETPTDPVNGIWVEHNIDSQWWTQSGDWTANNSKVRVVDVDKDGRLDVLLSHSERPGYPVSWYEASDPKNGPWTEHKIAQVDYCHTLQVVDMDNDGDLDVVVGEMPKSSGPDEVMVFVNVGDSLTWSKQVVATTGIYSGVVGDIGSDGDMDIVGSRNWDTTPIAMWENRASDPLDNWTYIQVDNSRAARAFGLAMGDLTDDGYGDIVSGRYLYRNPGGDMTGTWPRVTFPIDVDAMLIVDVDGDDKADVIGEALPDVYWLEAQDVQGNSWNSTKIGTIPKTSHENGQGYVLAQIVSGGRPEILLAGGTSEIYYFEIPENPSAGNWPRTLITSGATDEDIGVGDIDGDGDLDIAAGDVYSGGDKVAWWENPGDGTGNWTKYKIGTTDDWPDRFAVADLNGDGHPDIVVSEENDGTSSNAHVYWFEQLADPKSPGWTRHTLCTQYTTNSMDVADMDRDGDVDIITGEHRGAEKVAIWENVNNGSSWVEHVVATGRESHLGARVADLDGDGDLEIVSIAWDDYQFLHLWRNDAPMLTPSVGLPVIRLKEFKTDVVFYPPGWPFSGFRH